MATSRATGGGRRVAPVQQLSAVSGSGPWSLELARGWLAVNRPGLTSSSVAIGDPVHDRVTRSVQLARFVDHDVDLGDDR